MTDTNDIDWACAECGGWDTTGITNRNTGCPDDYDVECRDCGSRDVHESPREALAATIADIADYKAIIATNLTINLTINGQVTQARAELTAMTVERDALRQEAKAKS